MIKKVLKWTAIGAAVLVVLGLAGLAVHGVPRPPALTVEGVGRVPWRPALESLGAVRETLRGRSFSAWHPAERRVLVRAFAGMKPQIHRLDRPGGPLARLTDLAEPAGQIRFNPDPRNAYFVFGMDRGGSEFYQLYRFDLQDGTHHAITDGESRNIAGRFSRSGDLFAYTSTRRNGKDTDIYVVDPRRPETDRLVYRAEGTWYLGPWSPQDDGILALNYVSVGESRLALLDPAGGEMRDLFPAETERVAYGASAWSADGRQIFFVSNRQSEFMTARRLDLASGDVTPLTASISWDVEDLDLSPDGRTLALRVNEDGVDNLFLLDTGSHELRRVATPDGLVGSPSFHPQLNEVAWTHRDPSGLSLVCSYDVDADRLTRWTDVRASDLPAARLIHYPTFDDVDGARRTISAFVLDPPPGMPRPRGVLVNIHGGPEAQAGPILSPMHDMIRRRGIAIIAPNVRGSAGYGKTFLTLDNGVLREDSVRDIGALLDWIATQPDLDAGRVAVMGGSYGGYMTLASAMHYGERLRCAFEMVGISDFVTFLENTEDYRRDLRRAEYGDERDPEMRAFLESISPLRQADRIRIPLFVFSGRNDPRVPVTEGRQIVETVRANGGEVWYVEAANEGHGLSKPPNMLYVGAAGLKFFERCLN